MQTVYLHIGRSKTGTTAIQHFLASQRSALLKRGVHYVRADQQDFGKSFIHASPEYMVAPRNPEASRRKIAAEISRAKTNAVLISSTHFEMSEVSEVRRYFDELPTKCDVQIIFFVRSQDDLAEAEYNQLVKMGRLKRTFSSYLEQDLVGYDFMEAASCWEQYFGKENLHCRIYDSSKDVLGQFFSCLQMPLDPTLTRKVRKTSIWNASIGFKALTIARLLNTVDMTQRGRVEPKFWRWMQRKLWQRLAREDMPALLFNSDEAKAFRDRYAESNAAFTARFMNEAKSDLGGRKFSDDRRDEIRKQIKAMQLDSAELEIRIS